MAAADTSTGVGELKDELFELLDEVEDRGIGASAEVVEDLFEVVGELDGEHAGAAPHLEETG